MSDDLVKQFNEYLKTQKNSVKDKFKNLLGDNSDLSTSRWTSSKLWVFILTIFAAIWFKDVITPILWQVTILAGLFIVSKSVLDAYSLAVKAKVKIALIEALAKDGKFSEEDIKVISGNE